MDVGGGAAGDECGHREGAQRRATTWKSTWRRWWRWQRPRQRWSRRRRHVRSPCMTAAVVHSVAVKMEQEQEDDYNDDDDNKEDDYEMRAVGWGGGAAGAAARLPPPSPLALQGGRCRGGRCRGGGGWSSSSEARVMAVPRCHHTRACGECALRIWKTSKAKWKRLSGSSKVEVRPKPFQAGFLRYAYIYHLV